MASDRSVFIAPELAQKLKCAKLPILRKTLLAVCRFALDRTKLEHPIIENALRSLRNGKPLDSSSRRGLKMLALSLDDKYCDLNAGSQEDPAVYRTAALAAFRQARAVNAVYFAAQDNLIESASNCLYEAAAAAEDNETLEELVIGRIG